MLDPKETICKGTLLDSLMSVSVVLQTREFAVLSKPSGMVVSLSSDLDDSFTKLRSELEPEGQRSVDIAQVVADLLGPLYPICSDRRFAFGIMHRLDRETSGALLLAKTFQSFYDFRLQFACQRVVKEYMCIVVGRLDTKGAYHEITAPISSKKTMGKALSISSRVDDIDGSKALTEYTTLKNIDDSQLVRGPLSVLFVRTHTGRSHQIRVHLASIGHPLLNDGRYGKRNQPSAGRIMLHASSISFLNQSGKRISVSVDLPPDFQSVMHSLDRVT